MAHELEVSGNEVAFAFRQNGGLPWHGLGTPVDDNLSTAEMLKAAHCNGWDVRLEELPTIGRTEEQNFAVLRTNPFDQGIDQLAIVGSRYTPVQNETVADLGQAIVDGGAQWETIGSIKDGRRVFFALQLGDDIVLDPNGSADRIGKYLTVDTGHDGKTSVMAFMTDVRVVCQNTLTAAKSARFSQYKIRHTQSVDGRLEQARQALSIAFQQNSLFEQEMKELIEQEMTKQQFWTLVNGIYVKPEKDVRGSLKKWEKKTDLIMDIWNGQADGGNTVSELEDTKYKGYNVLSEHLTWYGVSRGGNTENLLIKASGMDDLTNDKNLDLFKAVAMA